MIDKEKIINILYGVLIILLFLAQLFFSINSTNQIRYEELAESVRNVFWLQHRIIYDGISSNVGWYGLLLIIYNLIGFSLNSTKFVRLIIHLLSLVFLSLMLKKYLGVKKAWLPLLAIGLSPTFLYFNTLQTSYGIDLDYLIISLFIFTNIKFKNGLLDVLKQTIFWSFNMIAWLSYPTFIFYLPSLTIFYLWKLGKNLKSNLSIIKTLSSNIFSFLLPFIVSVLYIKNQNIFLYDPVVKSGIFRGAGTFRLNFNLLFQNLNHVFNDLFHKGASYYFEITKADFSDFYPIISLTAIFSTTIFLFIKNKHYRLIILLFSITLLLTLFIANLTFDPTQHPGIRRNTPLIASVYGLLTVTWFYLNSQKLKAWIKLSILIIYLLIPLHHLLVYPLNLNALKNPSAYQYKFWFAITNSPSESLSLLVNKVKLQDLTLNCQDKNNKPTFCRYNEVYATVAGACLWNKLECKIVLGYDNKTQKFIPLSTKLWDDYYWEH